MDVARSKRSWSVVAWRLGWMLFAFGCVSLFATPADASCVMWKGQRRCSWAPQWNTGVGFNVDWLKHPGKLFMKNCVIKPKETFFIYIPNSNQDTIAKLNSKTGALEWTYNIGALAATRNFPKWNTFYDPSRTTVDVSGNVWVGLRGGYHIVGLTPAGKLVGAFNIGKMPRAMAVDRNNNIWAGAYLAGTMVKIVHNPKDGTYSIAQTVSPASGQSKICPYGATTDLHGNIWISSRCGGSLDQAVKIDFRTGQIVARVNIPSTYGIQADREGFVWVASYTDPGTNNGKIWKIDIHTNQLVKSYPMTNCRGRGITVDDKGQVWVACSHDSSGKVTNSLAQLNIATEKLRYFGDVGNFSIGVAIDAQGYVWSVSREEGRAFKTRVTDGASMGVFETCDVAGTKPCLGGNCPKCVKSGKITNARPYSYSDMTGYQCIQPPPRPGHGTWSSVFDAKCHAQFNSISWSEFVPKGTKVTVRARTAATKQDLATAAWGPYVASGQSLGVAANRFAEVEFRIDSFDCVVVASVIKASLDFSYFPEVCDGKDNDCDGKVDDFSTTCTSACGNGTKTCTAGQWGACTAPQPSQEVCDGKDNDCDGYVDENLTQTCTTACGRGTETCVGGAWKGCTAPQPTSEVCDGKDNDCNGTVDDGLTRPCRNNCGTGVETCSGGTWGNCNAPQPTQEICDRKDNDCDGQVDEGVSRACKTRCGTGREICTAGQWGKCSAPEPEPETCDGKDNDCNGQIDDDLTRPCHNICGKGQIVCRGGKWSSCSAGEPTREVCDGKDNDCNGKVDDDLRRPCSNKCGSGTEYCTDGAWKGCTAPQPQREVCDGKDNDCNGQTDDGLRRPCRNQCGAGLEVCNGGSWGACSAPTPTQEVCDGQDNDCNGQTDEGLGTKPCKNDCGEGRAKCSGGRWVCHTKNARPETCNNKDDDCNGKIDDGLERPCKNHCGEGTQTCEKGHWSSCKAKKSCGHGNNNNGNGGTGGSNHGSNPGHGKGGKGSGVACNQYAGHPLPPVLLALFVLLLLTSSRRRKA